MLNNERRWTDSWMLLNGGWNIMLKSSRLEDFSRGFASPCHFFHNGLQINDLVHGDYIFIVGRHEDRKHTLNLLRGGDELSKVETLGKGVVTV